MALRHTPCFAGYVPVKMVPRAGAHTGWLQKAFRNSTPREAIRSRFGVRFIGLSPMAPTQSQRNWSLMTRRTFGRAAPEGVCAGAPQREARRKTRGGGSGG